MKNGRFEFPTEMNAFFRKYGNLIEITNRSQEVINELKRIWENGQIQAIHDRKYKKGELIPKCEDLIPPPVDVKGCGAEIKKVKCQGNGQQEVSSSGPFLTPKYTFDNFVVGNGNRFAHAACLAVAQSPAKAYNPLFVYGEVGLGRDHLIQAICNYIRQHNPKTKVLYVSAAKFTNELVNSIKNDCTAAFREKYRSVDVLLVDDIQFLVGKERAQEEFYQIFNALYKASKQIVITSDRPPKDITNLEERLISRFEWGLITDIPPPDFETRIDILRKKAQSENLNVPNEVIDFIAYKIPSNIRQLEGALAKLIAHSVLTKKELSIPLAQEILKNKSEEVK